MENLKHSNIKWLAPDYTGSKWQSWDSNSGTLAHSAHAPWHVWSRAWASRRRERLEPWAAQTWPLPLPCAYLLAWPQGGRWVITAHGDESLSQGGDAVAVLQRAQWRGSSAAANRLQGLLSQAQLQRSQTKVRDPFLVVQSPVRPHSEAWKPNHCEWGSHQELQEYRNQARVLPRVGVSQWGLPTDLLPGRSFLEETANSLRSPGLHLSQSYPQHPAQAGT